MRVLGDGDMSEDSRWEVGGQNPSHWDWAHNYILINSRRSFHRFSAIEPQEAESVIDFIVELVHEIERLQTEAIELQDEADMWRHKHGYVTTVMPVYVGPYD